MPEKQFFNPYKPPKNMHVCCDRESLCLPTQLRDALNGHMTFNDSSGSKGPARSTMALRFGASCFFWNRGVNDYLVAGNWIFQNVCNLSGTLREKEKTKHVKEIKEHHLYLDYNFWPLFGWFLYISYNLSRKKWNQNPWSLWMDSNGVKKKTCDNVEVQTFPNRKHRFQY